VSGLHVKSETFPRFPSSIVLTMDAANALCMVSERSMVDNG